MIMTQNTQQRQQESSFGLEVEGFILAKSISRPKPDRVCVLPVIRESTGISPLNQSERGWGESLEEHRKGKTLKFGDVTGSLA